MTGRVVLGGIALSASHVFSVRQKMSVDSTSVSSVVAEISALIQEQQGGAEVHKLMQQIAAKATPGADGDYKKSMEEAIAAIEGEVEPKILASHKETQSKLNAALSAFRSQAGGASEAFDAAMGVDKAYFECVATEQALRQAVESAVQTEETANNGAVAACKAQEEDRSFAFDAAEGNNFGIDCDLGDAKACQSQMDKLEEVVKKMETDLTNGMDADQARYDSLKAVCDRKTEENKEARNARMAAQEAWSVKRRQCANSVAGRRESMCSFGTELVKKCELEANFNKLDAASNEEGHAMSESDRVQEWKAARTTKCMLQKYMKEGLDGSVNSDLLNACNEDDDKMKLDRADEVAKQLKEGVRCADGPITFANGQAWNVPEGKEPASSSYSKAAFKPAFSLTRGFGFCGRTIGEQNVGGGGGALGGGPLGGPPATFEDGSVLHELEGTNDCEVSWATVPTGSAKSVDPKLLMGSTLASWGCDRLQKAENYQRLQIGPKNYAVVSC